MDLCECLYPGRFWEAMDPYCMAVASVVIDGTSNVYFVHQTGPYMDFALACSWATGYPPHPCTPFATGNLCNFQDNSYKTVYSVRLSKRLSERFHAYNMGVFLFLFAPCFTSYCAT